jgi:hypothetical protein
VSGDDRLLIFPVGSAVVDALPDRSKSFGVDSATDRSPTKAEGNHPRLCGAYLKGPNRPVFYPTQVQVQIMPFYGQETP